MGHQRCSQPLWWEERFEEEAVWSRRSKRIRRRKQEGSEGSEESKGGLDRCSVRGDWNLPEQNQQQESISASEGSNLRETGYVLIYPWQVCEMSYWRKRDSQQMDRILLRTVQLWELWDNAVLDCSQPPEEDLQPIFHEEVEIAVASLKKEKSVGVDNIPAELVQAGGETMIDVLIEICYRIWRTGEWTQSLVITLPKKGNLQLCQNYRTISLISHSSKVMLKVILNRLIPQAEEIIAEEQIGFRAGRSTTEQIFNLRILCEKNLQHQQNLYHVFIDFKTTFDRVWHAALWATMRKYNIRSHHWAALWQAISAVQMNGSIGEWFRTTVGVRQGCLLSPTLFNIFLERIMSDALEEHDGKVSVGGRNITNLRFANDIDALAEEEQELEALVESLNKTCIRYKMEISAEKTKLMINSANGIQREIKVKRKKLGTVTSFKYLGAVVSDDGSKPEVLSRIEQATAALTKLKPIWRDNNISLGSKVKLMRSLVISIFLYACESWTLTAELEKRTQAFEMRCYWRLLNISYKDHVTNEEVRKKIQAAIGEYDELLTLVKKRKLRWLGHVSRSSGLAKTILQGTVKGKRKWGRQKKMWKTIKEWTGMDFANSTRAAENRSRWICIVLLFYVHGKHLRSCRDGQLT